MKLKVTIPTSLSDIKLSQYQKFIKTTKDSEDANFINRQMIAIFCNVPDSAIGKLRKLDYDEMILKVTEVLNSKSDLISITHYEGKELGFIPNNFEDLTVSELADIDNFIKDVSTYHKAMEVLYRPIKQKLKGRYLIEDYEPTGKGLDLTLDVVMGAIVFFYDLMNDLLNCTQNFIAEEVRTNKKLQNLGVNGDGIKTFTDSLAEVFLNLRKLAS
jgi:hypothetical protein